MTVYEASQAQRLERRLGLSLLGICVLSVILYAVMALSAFQVFGADPVPPLDEHHDILRAIQAVAESRGSEHVSPWIIAFGGAVITALLAAIKILWSDRRKMVALLEEAHQSTLQEAKSTARIRGEHLDRVEAIHLESIRERAEDRLVLSKLATALTGLENRCPLVGELGSEKKDE